MLFFRYLLRLSVGPAGHGKVTGSLALLSTSEVCVDCMFKCYFIVVEFDLRPQKLLKFWVRLPRPANYILFLIGW
jgi:hypothetical protein